MYISTGKAPFGFVGEEINCSRPHTSFKMSSPSFPYNQDAINDYHHNALDVLRIRWQNVSGKIEEKKWKKEKKRWLLMFYSAQDFSWLKWIATIMSFQEISLKNEKIAVTCSLQKWASFVHCANKCLTKLWCHWTSYQRDVENWPISSMLRCKVIP